MEYSKIKSEVTEIASDLISLVNVKEYDYTHQPSDENIYKTLCEAERKLAELAKKILYQKLI